MSIRYILGLALCVASLSGGAIAQDIVLRQGAFAIVCGNNEPESVRIAAEALQRDIKAVTGATIAISISLPTDASTPALVVVNRASDSHRAFGPGLRPLDGFESHRVYADPKMNRVYLDGYDARGAIYAIYTFSEDILGVPPLHFWCSWRAAPRETLRIPRDYDHFVRSPQVRFRTLLPGDTDFFEPWRKRSPEHDGIWLETALRLKLNTVEGYSTIEPGRGVSSYARLISRYGLVLASHHTSGLNTSFATWNAYWTRVRKMPVPKLRLSDEAAIREFFRYNAETVHQSGIENLWTLAFRGARDEPFWNIFEDAPKDDPGRAAVINHMLQVQLETIRQVTGEAAPQVRITFYDEIADLMAKGLLKPPATPNVIWTFVAARRDPYPYDDIVSFNSQEPVKLGYYMNFGFASTGAHVAPAEGPWRMEFNYRYVNAKAPLEFSVVNVGCLREFLLELSANARLLWDFSSYDTDRFLAGYCRQYFGPEHAAAVADLYRDYYAAFWQPKNPVFPGLSRQFVFQDLRYARAFDHIAQAFFASPEHPNMNPLRDIGFERVPGRTFRIDLADNHAANQIEALIAGMVATAPKFEAVAARCAELKPRLAPESRDFFYDNLEAFCGYMAHLSHALHAFALAYQEQSSRSAAVIDLERTSAELEKAQACLLATQHGAFAEWYTGAESMPRTFEVTKLKARILELKRQAMPTK